MKRAGDNLPRIAEEFSITTVMGHKGMQRSTALVAMILLGNIAVSLTFADTLAVYSFTNSTVTQNDFFSADYHAPGVQASQLRMIGIATTGVITNFAGSFDIMGYDSHFDGKAFETSMDVLTPDSTQPTPTNQYAQFTLSPVGNGTLLTITNVSIDFGFDNPWFNDYATFPAYDLYVSTNGGSSFQLIDNTSYLIEAAACVFDDHAVSNDLRKTVTGVSSVTNPVVFLLAFSYYNYGIDLAQKYIFIDDIVVRGYATPAITLEVTDSIAYEDNPDLSAKFRSTRSFSGTPLSVNMVFSAGRFTNGAATLGTDYTATATQAIVFASNQSSRTIEVRPINESPAEGPGRTTWAEPPETITLNLLPGTNYTILGPTNAVAVLYDDDQPRLPACFRDDFNSTNSLANWDVLTAGPTSVVTTLTFGFDYSSIVSNASNPDPNKVDTRGLKIAFSSAGPASNAVVNLFHTITDCCSTRYAVEFDLYMQYNAPIDLTNGPSWQAMAGINADTSSLNFVSFPAFAPQFSVGGAGQFITIAANQTTSTDFGGAKLWDPAIGTNVAAFPPTSPIIGQLLDNPPYGQNGGTAGIFGCDTSSTNMSWLHCQLFRLDDTIRFQVNGYPILHTNVSNMPVCSTSAAAGPIMPASGSPSENTIFIGAETGLSFSLSDSDHFAIIDNLEYIDFSSNAAFTGVAVDGQHAYFLFYSQASADYDAPSFRILSSGDLSNYTDLGDLVTREQIHDSSDVSGADGYFGGWYFDGLMYETGSASMFRILGTNLLESTSAR